MKPSSRSEIWIISEVYYPEDTSTGHYLTMIAEALAKERQVRVICARPTYSKRGALVPVNEERNGVLIYRTWSTAFDKNRKILRVVNMVSIALGLFFCGLIRVRSRQEVLVGTNPPTLAVLVAILCWIKRCRYSIKIEDVYPENMVAAGFLSADGSLTRWMGAVQRTLYLNADKVFVLGRDMEELIRRKSAPHPIQVYCIPNWADTETVQVIPRSENSLLKQLGLESKLVIGYSGNIGPLQHIDHIFNCMCALRDTPEIHFLVIGSGAMKSWLQAHIASENLSNVTVLDPRPRSEQSLFLGACDIGIVSLTHGMAGLGVPSRTYNIMAAGRPILASVDNGSEIAMLVSEERIGWVCKPGDVECFKRVALWAASNRNELTEIGARARLVAASKYSAARVLDLYTRNLSCPESL